MPAEVLYSQLLESEIDELAEVLHNAAVYEYIGGMPSLADFSLGLRRALAGPPENASGEYWINYAVRLAGNGQLIGRLEATVHHNLAEVAFLYAPSCWGQGFATRGLRWLHGHLGRYSNISSLWATTHPNNKRSAALLIGCGYVQATSQDLPLLYSYDEGDLVFCCSMARALEPPELLRQTASPAVVATPGVDKQHDD